MDTALPLAHRALALLENMDDATGVARLRIELGIIQLEMDPPDVDAALHNLERSESDSTWANVSPVDLASNRVAPGQGPLDALRPRPCRADRDGRAATT